MKCYYDLHIHTVLSACADILMTPNNLWNMATLKGLDFLALVDHNSAKQLPMLATIGESYQAKQVFGMELSLASGIHVLCYFEFLTDALQFSNWIETYLDPTPYSTQQVGEQILTDIEDFTAEIVPYYLNQPLKLGLQAIKDGLKPMNHLFVLAHWNRYFDLGKEVLQTGLFDAVEWTDFEHPYKGSSPVPILFNSDAHDLTKISEKHSLNSISVKEHSVNALFEAIRHGNHR